MPPHWKTAVFCPILKPGKPPTEATSYRPVAITSLVCRTFERVVSRRLMSFLHDKLSPVQFGFRPGYSTEDAIARVYGTLVKMANTRSVKYIERPNKKGTIVTSGKFTGHVSILGLLDLKDAFCRVPHKHLLDALALLQVPDYIMSIVAHWLTGRTSRTCVQGRYSSSLVLPCGVPQGSVLGPILFVVFIDGLLTKLEDQYRSMHHLPVGCCTTAYADDVSIIVSGACSTQVIEAWNRLLAFLVDWLNSHNMILSPKSEYLFFCHSGHDLYTPAGSPNKSPKLQVDINNSPLPLKLNMDTPATSAL
ncbi:endonuclease/reverse transcriptase [Angomonas deanei]|uniref:Reverse transcriptase (RNA-dependent DNA polymerase), putative n=1 Tax=Angomonas deanei TaxID=59799 RepID=A0A7G2CSK8_9TRYP|nr:endonuclease/reverse transcriptase [Angomonas deanei]CAD2222545.1 Reverse transcriptase (RNA-dependent DNA polymerase), putative [Angomonas deanei]|eukprot:EPY35179.1 endonuclease/reverse transcriptase [Angomonas deanei]